MGRKTFAGFHRVIALLTLLFFNVSQLAVAAPGGIAPTSTRRLTKTTMRVQEPTNSVMEEQIKAALGGQPIPSGATSAAGAEESVYEGTPQEAARWIVNEAPRQGYLDVQVRGYVSLPIATLQEARLTDMLADTLRDRQSWATPAVRASIPHIIIPELTHVVLLHRGSLLYAEAKTVAEVQEGPYDAQAAATRIQALLVQGRQITEVVFSGSERFTPQRLSSAPDDVHRLIGQVLKSTTPPSHHVRLTVSKDVLRVDPVTAGAEERGGLDEEHAITQIKQFLSANSAITRIKFFGESGPKSVSGIGANLLSLVKGVIQRSPRKRVLVYAPKGEGTIYVDPVSAGMEEMPRRDFVRQGSAALAALGLGGLSTLADAASSGAVKVTKVAVAKDGTSVTITLAGVKAGYGVTVLERPKGDHYYVQPFAGKHDAEETAWGAVKASKDGKATVVVTAAPARPLNKPNAELAVVVWTSAAQYDQFIQKYDADKGVTALAKITPKPAKSYTVQKDGTVKQAAAGMEENSGKTLTAYLQGLVIGVEVWTNDLTRNFSYLSGDPGALDQILRSNGWTQASRDSDERQVTDRGVKYVKTSYTQEEWGSQLDGLRKRELELIENNTVSPEELEGLRDTAAYIFAEMLSPLRREEIVLLKELSGLRTAKGTSDRVETVVSRLNQTWAIIQEIVQGQAAHHERVRELEWSIRHRVQRLLIVAGDPSLRQFLVEWAKTWRQTLQITEAESPEGALALWNTPDPFDAVLAGYDFPGNQNGIQLIEAIQGHSPGRKVPSALLVADSSGLDPKIREMLGHGDLVAWQQLQQPLPISLQRLFAILEQLDAARKSALAPSGLEEAQGSKPGVVSRRDFLGMGFGAAVALGIEKVIDFATAAPSEPRVLGKPLPLPEVAASVHLQVVPGTTSKNVEVTVRNEDSAANDLDWHAVVARFQFTPTEETYQGDVSFNVSFKRAMEEIEKGLTPSGTSLEVRKVTFDVDLSQQGMNTPQLQSLMIAEQKVIVNGILRQPTVTLEDLNTLRDFNILVMATFDRPLSNEAGWSPSLILRDPTVSYAPILPTGTELRIRVPADSAGLEEGSVIQDEVLHHTAAVGRIWKAKEQGVLAQVVYRRAPNDLIRVGGHLTLEQIQNDVKEVADPSGNVVYRRVGKLAWVSPVPSSQVELPKSFGEVMRLEGEASLLTQETKQKMYSMVIDALWIGRVPDHDHTYEDAFSFLHAEFSDLKIYLQSAYGATLDQWVRIVEVSMEKLRAIGKEVIPAQEAKQALGEAILTVMPDIEYALPLLFKEGSRFPDLHVPSEFLSGAFPAAGLEEAPRVTTGFVLVGDPAARAVPVLQRQGIVAIGLARSAEEAEAFRAAGLPETTFLVVGTGSLDEVVAAARARLGVTSVRVVTAEDLTVELDRILRAAGWTLRAVDELLERVRTAIYV